MQHSIARGDIGMDSGGLGFWRTVWASILAGVAVVAIVAAASWAFGFHHQVWLAIVATASWFWGVLSLSVSVPVVLLVIFLGATLCVGWAALLHKREVHVQLVAGHKSRAIVATAEPAPLTDNEITVIRVLADADGRSMNMGTLATNASLPNLVTEQAIDRLLDRNFLFQATSFDRGRVYSLSPEGRDYAIAAGYVGNPASEVARFPF